MRDETTNFKNEKTFEFTVYPPDTGTRLDIFLSRQMLDLSRSQVKKAVDEGLVRVNHDIVKVSCRLKTGDIVRIHQPKPIPDRALPQDIPLSVVYEDPHIMVVDKPAGMVVHPAAGHYQDTLVNALLFHCGDLSGIGGVLRPGIVHRLDKNTSGLMLVAKSDAAHRGLSEQFKRHEVRKIYKALVYGNPKADEGMMDQPLGRHPTDRKKMSTYSRRGKDALTHWRVLERYGAAALLEVDIKTGRTHQIRVHLMAAGYPVVGDHFYAGPKRINAINPPILRSKLKTLNRQALHASELSFSHPITHEALSFSSPIPDDMADLMHMLTQWTPTESRA